MVGQGQHGVHGRHHRQRAPDGDPMLADIAEGNCAVARRMGHEPRVAFLSYSTFGNPLGKWLEQIREAVAILDERGVELRI
jgi:phosphotransacetylase